MKYAVYENVSKEALKKAIQDNVQILTFLEPNRSNVWQVESDRIGDNLIWLGSEKEMFSLLDMDEQTVIVSDRDIPFVNVTSSLAYLFSENE